MSKDEEIKIIERNIKSLPLETLKKEYFIDGKLITLKDWLVAYKNILIKEEKNSEELKKYSDKLTVAIKYDSLPFIPFIPFIPLIGPIIGRAIVSMLAVYCIKKHMDKN